MTTLNAALATDVGRVRSINQDMAFAGDRLVVVADGMGGHAGGEVAAKAAVEGLERSFATDATAEGLVAAAQRSNEEIFDRATEDEELHGMGTTLVAAAVVPGVGGRTVALVNVGDSRAYLLEDGRLRRLTEDHSLVEEMMRRNEITADEASVHPYRHILTRALGIDRAVEVDSWIIELNEGSRLLLCSDGLTNECDEDEIAAVLVENPEPADAAHALVRRALAHGGNDNVTAVVADVIFDPPPLADSGPVEQPAPPAEPSRPRRVPDVPAPRPVARATASGTPTRARRTARSRVHAAARPAEAAVQLITFRVALFLFALVAVLGGAAGFTYWFNQATYYVTTDGSHVAIFEGRPGGLLWFRPHLVVLTGLDVSAVLPANLPLLREGMLESSYDAARKVVADLKNERSILGITTTSAITGRAPIEDGWAGGPA